MTEAWRCMLLLLLQKEENVQVRYPLKALLCMLEKLLLYYFFSLYALMHLGKSVLNFLSQVWRRNMIHIRARSVSRSTIEGGMLVPWGWFIHIGSAYMFAEIVLKIIDASSCQFLMQAEIRRDDLSAREGNTLACNKFTALFTLLMLMESQRPEEWKDSLSILLFEKPSESVSPKKAMEPLCSFVFCWHCQDRPGSTSLK